MCAMFIYTCSRERLKLVTHYSVTHTVACNNLHTTDHTQPAYDRIYSVDAQIR